MSSIVTVSGTYDERQHIHRQVGEGLVSLGSSHTSNFYAKVSGLSFKESDVISVAGKPRVVRFAPGEAKNNLYGDKYLSPDYLVVLREGDTLLYHLQDYVPQTHAELGLIRSYLMLIAAIAAGAVGLTVSLWAGSGWWSLLVAIGFAILALAYFFVLAYPLWASIAALRGAGYIWWQVLVNGRSRRDYREVVAHLSDSDEPYLTLIHKILRYLI